MRLTRRTLLKGATGAAMALPFLEATARAAGTAPLRLVIMTHGQGTMLERWTPSGGAELTLPQLLAPLAALKHKLNVCSGISNNVRKTMTGNGHNPAGRSLLSAHGFAVPGNEKSASAGPSIDQVLAQRLKSPTALPSLELRVGGTVGENQMLFSAPGVPVTGSHDPQAVWSKLMGLAPAAATAAAPASMPAPAPPTAAERLRAKRPQMLDLVKARLNEVRAHVGVEDRQRLDAHAARVAEMEATLSSTSLPRPNGGGGGSLMCTKPALGLPAGYTPANVQMENLTASAQIKNLVMALSCDTTRVATLQFSNYHAPTFDWLNLGLTGNWHDRVHNGGGNNKEGMAQAFTWYTHMFNELLVQMDQVNEGDGTMLDNSLVLWISEFGNGGVHSTANLPVVLAGGLGGKLKTGRHLAFAGRSHNDLYTTILNLFDQPDTSFGHPSAEFNKGPLALG